ncbi:hypothetical protein DRO69_00925 [Candidatus Bathyarchaeota archaeon]|nr:MAG: hypothetical protein DRO69_00925 [Candidatus Bathyarchaeota archaeon]
MTDSKIKIERTTKIATPSVGIDGINHAVRALRAYKEPATYKDLAKGANLHPVYMSQSLSAARDVGLTESAGKRGLYKLTSDGEEYARFLSYGQESECKELLKRIILNNPLWSEIIRFLRMSKGEARDPLLLVGDIEGKLGKRWSPSMRSGYASAYTSILEFAGLIRVEGGNMVSELELEEKPEKGEKPAGLVPESRAPLPTTLEEYTEFSIADSFKVLIRKDIESLEFFEDQIKEKSIFSPWIAYEKKKLEKEGSGKRDLD